MTATTKPLPLALPGHLWLGGLLAAAACLSAAPEALATASIQTRAIALRVIPAPTTTPVDRNCVACHTRGRLGASNLDLHPGLRIAYRNDTVRLTQMRALLSQLPTTTVGTVNSGIARTDVYEVICTTDAVSLSAAVRDLAPVMLPTVSARISRGTQRSRTVTDPTDGDALFSPQTRLPGPANSIYLVRVTKSAYTGTVAMHRGPETYNGQLACRNAAGAQTGLAWRLIQNQ